MEDIKWLVGAALGVIAMLGAYIARDRAVFKSIREGDAALDARIDRVKDDYVRRVDLESHITHLEKSLNEIREDQRHHHSELNKRFDRLMEIMSTRAGGQ